MRACRGQPGKYFLMRACRGEPGKYFLMRACRGEPGKYFLMRTCRGEPGNEGSLCRPMCWKCDSADVHVHVHVESCLCCAVLLKHDLTSVLPLQSGVLPFRMEEKKGPQISYRQRKAQEQLSNARDNRKKWENIEEESGDKQKLVFKLRFTFYPKWPSLPLPLSKIHCTLLCKKHSA